MVHRFVKHFFINPSKPLCRTTFLRASDSAYCRLQVLGPLDMAAVRYTMVISLILTSLPVCSQVLSLPQWGQIFPWGTVS